MTKGGRGSCGLARMSRPWSGGAGFVTRGDSGSWADTWQTRCMSGINPQLPGTSKPIWGLLTGIELHLQPSGMNQEWVFLVFPYIPLHFPQFCLETPLLHQGTMH